MSEHPSHLYLHVPFCAHRCGYCAFVTVSERPELHDQYVDALATELRLREADRDASYETIFIGGGTPTLLRPSALERLLVLVRRLAAPGAEITIEANPETIDRGRAQQLLDGGVTRVSLGAQSLEHRTLDLLERRASPADIRSAVTDLRAAGLENLNLDLIWGVPGQTCEALAHDVDQLLELEPDHVSAYELEFKPGTRLTTQWGSAEAAVGDDADPLYDLVIDRLTGAGLAWYETANFARPGHECRHNLAYWTQQDYQAAGIGAVSTVGGTRRMNRPNIVRYLRALEEGELPPASLEELGRRTRQQERIMLALRLARPLMLEQPDAPLIDLEQLEVLRRAGMVLPGPPDRIELSRGGRTLLNDVTVRLLT